MVHFYKTGTSGDKGTLLVMMIVALRCCIFDPKVFSIHTLSRSNQCLHIFHALLRFSLIVCLCVAFIVQLAAQPYKNLVDHRSCLLESTELLTYLK